MSSKLEKREERIGIVNRIILEIASRGRMFMKNHTNGTTSYFSQEGRNLWFIDKHSGQKIYPYNHSEHSGFTEGGTLWGLVNGL